VAERTGATVEIIFRRDFERLARRWNLPQLAPSDDDHVWAAPAVGTERHLGDARGIGFDRLFRVGEARLPDGAVVVEVEGDVDLHSAPELRDRLNALIGDGAERVVVDLSEATFLDSMALGVLLGAKREVADRDGMLELVVATDDIRRIFEITMLERIFRIHPTRAEALGADGSS
jgi:anti-sigma B factor antagonist